MFKRYTYVEGLTSLNFNEEGVLINILGQIKDKFGNDLPITRDAQGHKVVNVQSWDGKKDYRVIDLMIFQFKSLKIPQSKFGKVIGFVIDGNKDNCHAENIGYRFEGGKLEVDGYPGFYYIPGFTSNAINVFGDLFTVKTKNIRVWSKTNPDPKRNTTGGYHVVNVWFSTNVQVHLSRHRALCLVFKEYPDNVDTMTVNHIDGVPGNDSLDNLEWLTRSANNLHAFSNGLKNQNREVLVRDVRTGEVIEYYSITECSRALNYSDNGSSIHFRLKKCPFSQVFQDGKQFKFKSDDRDWIIPEDPEKAIKDAQYRTSVKSKNCFTLIETVYDSLLSAEKATGIQSPTILYRLKRNDDSPLYGYQFKYSNDKTSWSEFTIEDLRKSLLPPVIGVDCRNLLTNDSISFDSIKAAEIHFENSNIGEVLRRGKQPLYSTGWQIKLSIHEWEEIDNFEEAIYKKTREIQAKNEETGGIILADSASKLAEILNLDPRIIRKAAFTHGNMIYQGYRFRLGMSTDPWPTVILP